jgi:hypothetical protein
MEHSPIPLNERLQTNFPMIQNQSSDQNYERQIIRQILNEGHKSFPLVISNYTRRRRVHRNKKSKRRHSHNTTTTRSSSRNRKTNRIRR